MSAPMAGVSPGRWSERWGDLGPRLASGIVLLCVAGFCLWRGGVVWNALILLVMFGLAWEGERLVRQDLRSWRGALLLAWPVVSGLAATKGEWRGAFWMIWPALIFGVPACAPVIVSMLGGLSLIWLRALPHGAACVLFVLAVVIASDSLAYATGRIVGGPKLAPAISPGKTRSGALGGLFGAALAGGIVAHVTGLGPVGGAVLWGAVLGVAAQAGDLAESAVKRHFGVKDSGHLIPGHGGLLDRFDALLAAAPLAALLSLACPGSACTGPVFWSLSVFP